MYMVIDLKSFYAACECKMRNLDMFKTRLAVCDTSRGPGAIVLAATPALKACGIPSRTRYNLIPKELNCIYAKPRMKLYISMSCDVFECYLKFFSSEDIYVYSIDECFINLEPYQLIYNDPLKLAQDIKEYVYCKTGLVVTAGIGTNMFLAKVALDVISKHEKSNIGYLDVARFKEKIWPITDLTSIWSIGHGIERRLHHLGIFSVSDIAQCPKEILYKEFGIIGLELYDHAWGIDETKLSEVKNVKVKSKSISEGQVLFKDYNLDDAKIVLVEMIDVLVYRLILGEYKTHEISLYIGYSDNTGVGKSISLDSYTNDYNKILKVYKAIYDKYVIAKPIRRIMLCASRLAKNINQISLFNEEMSDNKLYNSIRNIKAKYGKNAILKAISLMPNANQINRNKLIGGHNE